MLHASDDKRGDGVREECVPVEALLPHLRRVVRNWEGDAAGRKKRRVDHFTCDRGGDKGSSGESEGSGKAEPLPDMDDPESSGMD